MSNDPTIPNPPDAPEGPWNIDVAPRAGSTTSGRSTPEGPPHRFQFTLSQLIVLMTLVAVFCASAISVPGWLSMILAGCFAILLPMAFTVGIVYGRGYQRTFCMGALFPSGIVGFQGLSVFGLFLYRPTRLGGDFDSEARLWVWVFLLAVCGVSIAFGLLAMGLRWMIESSRRRVQTSDHRPGPSSESPFPDE